MWSRLIIEENSVYELDEECLEKKQKKVIRRGNEKPGTAIRQDKGNNN